MRNDRAEGSRGDRPVDDRDASTDGGAETAGSPVFEAIRENHREFVVDPVAERTRSTG